MAKRLKLKKNVWVCLVIIIFLFIGIYSGIHLYKNYKYKQSYEYKLITHGYSKNDTKLLLKNFKSNKEREFFLNQEVNDAFIKIIKEKYYLKKNFSNYIKYLKNNPRKNIEMIVRDVNVHLDHKFYEVKFNTDTSKDIEMMVNKYYLLDEKYAPDDLVYISQKYAWGDKNSKQVRRVCYDAFIEMWNSAMESDIYLMINSSYRSFNEQKKVYDSFEKERGKNYADSIAARPGASEHETGLALDIFSIKNSNKKTFEDSPEALWLKDNAYKFGFVLRYPKGKENITGYDYEPWHYRYVGKKAAKYCYENDITFDEYYAYFIE